MYSGTVNLAFCGTGNGLGVGRGIGGGEGNWGWWWWRGGRDCVWEHLNFHSENVVQFSLPVSV